MPVNVLLFDLDGTLVDTIIDITNALNFALKPAGIREFTADDAKALVGEGITKLLEKVLSEGKRDFTQEAVNRFVGYYRDHLIDQSSLYPDVKETLGRLGNFRKAVISNKRECLTTGALKGFGLLGYFELVAGSDTAPGKKPSPAPVLYALRKLGARPEEAVMIGDSNFDIAAGKNAGVVTVAVTYGYCGRQTLTGADYLIDEFRELPSVLLGIF